MPDTFCHGRSFDVVSAKSWLTIRTVQRFHALRPPPVTRSASTCVPFAMRVVFQPRPAANANGLRESLQTHLAVDEEVDAARVALGRDAPGLDARQRLAVLDRRRADVERVEIGERELADEPHVVTPPPVRTGVGVVIRAAEERGILRVGHLRVADDVLAVDRDVVAPDEPGDELRGGRVLGGREAGRVVGLADVLDPDGVDVDLPVAGMPRDVGEVHQLHDRAVARDHVVRGRVRVAAGEPPDVAE